ncbi:hypothetical protein FB451DRAFT_1194905 [Mycena latifolia]|nr:hypothetical protein FB451DRAFT_1194905 [Mycena latifolia]
MYAYTARRGVMRNGRARRSRGERGSDTIQINGAPRKVGLRERTGQGGSRRAENKERSTNEHPAAGTSGNLRAPAAAAPCHIVLTNVVKRRAPCIVTMLPPSRRALHAPVMERKDDGDAAEAHHMHVQPAAGAVGACGGRKQAVAAVGGLIRSGRRAGMTHPLFVTLDANLEGSTKDPRIQALRQLVASLVRGRESELKELGFFSQRIEGRGRRSEGDSVSFEQLLVRRLHKPTTCKNGGESRVKPN